MTFFLYNIPILLSLSFSFLFHAFKKSIHPFFCFATTFNNYKLHLKRHNSSTNIMHLLDSPPLPKPSLSPPSLLGFINNNANEEIEGLVTSNENLEFESIDERRVNAEIDDNENNSDNDDDEDSCRNERGNWRKMNTFPPLLSSLNRNGQPSFRLLPVRKNGRLQLRKVRIKRAKILYAMRQDGRLKLFLVPDRCILDDVEEEEEKADKKHVEKQMKEEEKIVEPLGELEENGYDDVVEEVIRSEEEDIRVGKWKFPSERFERCHEGVNHIHSHHVYESHHHHLRICEVSTT
ncbi:uncharacterized protein LOC113871648 [Abrus precatorius]|uniref:Uncharacterized protein LOC113871648 n=1 Tax=Abrus precatorius TaxID=3816 RepID=A0A8B8M9R7_ABRPR|nr:uncharacterized protein LOC113871648 [Abrus precatorius]